MRVARNYYNDQTYYRPEVVRYLVEYCNRFATEQKEADNLFLARVAHQLKCWVIKRYSRNSGPAFIPLCAVWESDPLNAIKFLGERKARDPKRLDVVKGAKELSPETII